jgi:lytic murein transglycosylase
VLRLKTRLEHAMKKSIALTLLALSVFSSPVHADFASCVAGLRSSALSQGISASTFDSAMSGIEPDMKIIELMDNQPEFKTPIWDYLGTLVDDEKIADGKAMMRKYSATLAAAEERYGVDRHTIAAVWGVESDFGKAGGKFALMQALPTVACFAKRRNDYFKSEFMAALKIIERGDLAASKMRGSWAGAFGHTQFMPSTYLRLAVDGDGDGRRDLVDSVPDALHSTANYLAKAGWQTGASWGYEVRIPGNYNGTSGRTAKQPVSSWASRGITKIDGSALTGSSNAGLLLPAGKDGPAFIVFKNYDAAYSYNGADSYALAISLLSDRLKGKQGIQAEWPTDDLPLNRNERRELQTLLIAKGYDVGEPDGAVGSKTKAAIKDVEGKSGMNPTGRPGSKVLKLLKGG